MAAVEVRAPAPAGGEGQNGARVSAAPAGPIDLEAVAAAWDLGGIASVERLPGGKSEHLRLATGRGVLALRRSYRSKTTAAAAFEHELMGWLAAAGFPVPAVVPARDGRTVVEIGGRLYRLTTFMVGSPYRAGAPRQLEAVADTLGRYHRAVTSFQPSVAPPEGSDLIGSLRTRLDAVARQATKPSGAADLEPDRHLALRHLAAALDDGRAALDRLTRLDDRWPRLVVHGGCRRGSTLFEGDRLVALLDFDSAHVEARVVDVAVALHDFAKVYGDPASPAFKVPLDIDVVRAFVAAYDRSAGLEPAERAALPDLLVAKRLKRALGRFDRLVGDGPVSRGDVAKVELELARVRWLSIHRGALEEALTGAGRRVGTTADAGEGAR
jgi:homoserine kinase type II